MDDLISRKTLIESITDVEVAWYMDGNYTTYDSTTIMDIIEEQPVKNKTGKWLGKPFGGYSTVRCSNCGMSFKENSGRWKFCPECGADMRD